jgi:hypothetical protein
MCCACKLSTNRSALYRMSIHIVGLFNYVPCNKTCRKLGHDDRELQREVQWTRKKSNKRKLYTSNTKKINFFLSSYSRSHGLLEIFNYCLVVDTTKLEFHALHVAYLMCYMLHISCFTCCIFHALHVAYFMRYMLHISCVTCCIFYALHVAYFMPYMLHISCVTSCIFHDLHVAYFMRYMLHISCFTCCIFDALHVAYFMCYMLHISCVTCCIFHALHVAYFMRYMLRISCVTCCIFHDICLTVHH